jgi:hypothetical protein
MSDVTQEANPNPFPDMVAPETTQDVGISAEALQPPVESATSQPKKHIVGNRVFDSAEEALAYANGLMSAQSQLSQSVLAPEPEHTDTKKKLGTLIFEDPDAALEEVKRQAKEEWKSEQQQLETYRNFWNDFYSKHSDLKNAEILVDAVYQKELAKGSWSNVSLEQGAEMLAQKARQEVSRIRGAANGGQALPSKPAMVASSSGGQVPAVPAPQQVSKTFVDELRTMRKRG